MHHQMQHRVVQKDGIVKTEMAGGPRAINIMFVTSGVDVHLVT